jgi:hypothetical protein
MKEENITGAKSTFGWMERNTVDRKNKNVKWRRREREGKIESLRT